MSIDLDGAFKKSAGLLTKESTLQHKKMAAAVVEADPDNLLGITPVDLMQLQILARDKAPEALRPIMAAMFADRDTSFADMLQVWADTKKQR